MGPTQHPTENSGGDAVYEATDSSSRRIHKVSDAALEEGCIGGSTKRSSLVQQSYIFQDPRRNRCNQRKSMSALRIEHRDVARNSEGFAYRHHEQNSRLGIATGWHIPPTQQFKVTRMQMVLHIMITCACVWCIFAWKISSKAARYVAERRLRRAQK